MVEGFAFNRQEVNKVFGYAANEDKAVITYCIKNKIPYKFCNKISDVPSNFIPVGSVKFCENFIPKYKTIPDYYPEFLNDFLFRKIWKSDKWIFDKNVFVKPADKHKRFNGFVTIGGYHKKKKPPLYCSEVVKFTNEWRYYISNGEVLTGEWYSGDEINTPDAPELNIKFPNNFCGAVDFGYLKTGEFALVECNPPYSCGWYGKNDDLYVKWLIEGWKFLNE